MDYIAKLVDVRCADCSLDPADPAARHNWEQAYLAFGGVHPTMMGTTIAFVCDTSTGDGGLITAFLERASAFICTEGELLFRFVGRAFAQANVATACAAYTKVASLHKSVIADRAGLATTDIPSRLILAPTPADLARPASEGAPTTDDASDQYLAEMPHNKAVAHLKAFLDIEPDCKTMLLPRAILRPGSTEALWVETPREAAATILACVAHVRNLSLAVSTLNAAIVTVESAAMDSSEFGGLVDRMVFFKYVVALVDEFVASPAVGELENLTDLQLDTPVSIVSAWVANVSVYGGAAQDEIIRKLVAQIDSAKQTAVSAVPLWKAAVKGDRLDIALGCNIVQGRLNIVVAQHSHLRNLLTRAGAIAQRLQLTPRFQEHALSAQVAAESLSALSALAEASVVMKGFALLGRTQDSATGNAAVAFLKAHNTEDNMKNIPNAFWNEFRNLAQYAGPANELGSLRLPPAASPTKTKSEDATGSTATGASPQAKSEISAAASSSQKRPSPGTKKGVEFVSPAKSEPNAEGVKTEGAGRTIKRIRRH